MQHMTPLFRDENNHEMYFERYTDSEFELLLQDERIDELEEPKLEVLPDAPTRNSFDIDYSLTIFPSKVNHWMNAIPILLDT